MRQQKSFAHELTEPTLYLVPTPIGNLEDMTYRAVNILKKVDFIAAEDTRNTKKLCNHFEITTPLLSYHEHNRKTSGDQIIQKLKYGQNIAIVSDAGMPGISDPGFELVQEALAENIAVVALPGANAALTALIASGIPSQPFYFYGFLNRSKKEKKIELERLKLIEETVIFYEAPHRLKETLLLMEEYFGDRKAVLARELTKKFEEYIRGSLSEMVTWASTNEIRGEFVLIVEGAEPVPENESDLWWYSLSIEEHVRFYIETNGWKANEAIKQTAKDRKKPKREIYAEYHVDGSDNN